MTRTVNDGNLCVSSSHARFDAGKTVSEAPRRGTQFSKKALMTLVVCFAFAVVFTPRCTFAFQYGDLEYYLGTIYMTSVEAGGAA